MRGNRAAAPTRGSRIEWREVRPRRVVARSADIEAMGETATFGFWGLEAQKERVYVRLKPEEAIY